MRIHPSSRVRALATAVGGAALVAMLAAPTTVLAGTAASAAAQPIEVENDETHWAGTFEGLAGAGAAIKGIAIVASRGGDKGALAVALQGLSRNARHALLASSEPCGTPHDRTAVGIRFDGVDGEVVASKVNVRRSFTRAGFLSAMQGALSFRVLRTSAPRGQVACAPVVAYGSPAATASTASSAAATKEYELKNVLVSSFVAPGDVAGMVLATPDVETFSLSFEEIKQTVGTHRIVGSTARCGTPTNAGRVVFSYSFGATQTGNFAADATAPTQRDPLSVASIRFFGGTSGFARQEGCSNIIAVLIAL